MAIDARAFVRNRLAPRALALLLCAAGAAGGIFGAAAGALIGAMLDALRAEISLARAAARCYAEAEPPPPAYALPASLAAFARLSGLDEAGALACAAALGATGGFQFRRFWEAAGKALAQEGGGVVRRRISELRSIAGEEGAEGAARAALRCGPGEVCLAGVPFGSARADRGPARLPEGFLEALRLLGLGPGKLEALLSDFGGRAEASIRGPAERDRARDYELLGLKPGAGAAAAKKAYRELARQFHPDSLAGLDEDKKRKAAEAFLKIKEAYGEISGD